MPGRRRPNERGAIAVWASVVIVAFVIIVGAGVDFAGHAAAEQHARAVAHEAARAGGQYVHLDATGVPRAEVARVVQAANAYVAASGLEGGTTVTEGEIRVSVHGTYPTVFLGVIGVDELPLRGSAVATVNVVVAGEVR